jgi:hypothetical protein
VVGIPSFFVGGDILFTGKTDGIIQAIGLLLAWIGGTLVWGLAALMFRKVTFELPPAFAQIADSLARMEKSRAAVTESQEPQA